MAKGEGKKIAIGAAVAAVTGYVAGILTAPKSGKQTREDIKETAEKGAAEAKKDLKKAHAELDKTMASAEKQAGKLRGEAKNELEAALAKANTAKNKAAGLLDNVHNKTTSADFQKTLKDVTKAFADLKKQLKR